MDRENLIAALIASAHDRAEDARRQDRPSERGDRISPVGAQWLRRWRPRPIVMPLPDCACATGRCGVCN